MGLKSKTNLMKKALKKQIDKIYPNKESLEKILKLGKKLTIYWGIDPTSPDVHLGHSTNLFVLRRLQKLGHKIIILIGDYTAQIGDPTGKDKKRKILTENEVKENFRTYKNQILKILDAKKTFFRFNSEWWNKMNAKELLALDDLVTYQQIIERDMFQRRIKEDKPISMKELQYPLLQGYDSVVLKADIELGATDQLFNMLVGRDLVKTFLKKEKFIITTPLLINPKTNSKLMSKSEGNYISLNDSPSEMYGKIMALPDGVILTCFQLCTDVDDGKIRIIESWLKSGENPRNLKAELAFEVVKIYHGEKKAKEAAEEFERVFKKHELPKSIQDVPITIKEYNIIELLIHLDLALSRSQARRLVLENAIKVNSRVVNDPMAIIDISEGIIVQSGKRNFRRIVKK
ncbi:tyrosine--tRNA ligase [Candidatus Azambacteria bacterium RIFCSPHIGHO2_01_FULL_40_24]|uniref:Tyrosine--tRNA ligase n=1 Tax=Candidatus Azambacteria bacterium RIFCSPHIGHO2_01_FULL_40_24 TaxID=1797301 RepID=A0A1F5B4N4_9BACT|nr:MAG: tyrosine--tRNA ligase [Candidatus Azambacteria bacterium RIFCSPHIGHO2_01_FULL_40_24]